jgi:uncharacterized protein
MGIELADNHAEGRYEATVDGQLAGFVQYRLQEPRITMYHTEVDPGYEGRGVGGELAKFALGDVRERGLEVVPICPFIASYVRHHPDQYLDLVIEELREQVMAGG